MDERKNTSLPNLHFSPFTFFIQRRYKHTDSAQIRLEKRITDHAFERLRRYQNKLRTALNIIHLMRRKNKSSFVSLQRMSKWKNTLRLNIRMGVFVHTYPQIFHTFTHPIRRNLCCSITSTMEDFINHEEETARDSSLHNIVILKKLLKMSSDYTLPVHSLRLVRKELGFPSDFVESFISENPQEFMLLESGSEVRMVSVDQELGNSYVEKWRKKEYVEKWVKESEIKYAFPVNLPPQFVKGAGFKERMRKWQLLPYLKVYESVGEFKGLKYREKRAVGVIHEFLSLTVEKMVPVDRLVFFMDGFGLKGVNIRELLLKHPGIFYISARGRRLFVFLREAYWKGGLVEADHPVYNVRRKMLEFMFRCDMGKKVENVSNSCSSSLMIMPSRNEDLKK